MKKTAAILAIAFVCFFTPACNNETGGRADKKNEISASEVPGVVKDAFAAKHPAAAGIIWEDAHEKDVKTYKVKFKWNDKYMKAEYKEDGSLIKENVDK
jgi:hypothetical protein